MKDMRQFKKYFSKNESLLMETAKAHRMLLSKHKEMMGGLEKDVSILTDGFLQSLGQPGLTKSFILTAVCMAC